MAREFHPEERIAAALEMAHPVCSAQKPQRVFTGTNQGTTKAEGEPALVSTVVSVRRT